MSQNSFIVYPRSLTRTLTDTIGSLVNAQILECQKKHFGNDFLALWSQQLLEHGWYAEILGDKIDSVKKFKAKSNNW